MTEAILVLNAGSSSIKFAVYPVASTATGPLVRGKIKGIRRAPEFNAVDSDGEAIEKGALASIDASSDHHQLTDLLLDWLDDHNRGFGVVAVGHRVVHGGRNYATPVTINSKILQELKEFITLAPLHQPNNLAPIETLLRRDGKLTQIACFDTAFHRTQMPLAELFALPRSYTEEGVIRYGFHGLSYEYIANALPQVLGETANGRMIVAHLGNGASLCAMRNRKSVATSMGFTALDGLVMGSRCGALDPGVVLYFMQERGMDAEEIQHLLYNESGLLGVSGISNNMQVLLASEETNAKEAVDLFCYRAATEIASLMVPLKGLDAIIFTAGIGENSAPVRARICDFLEWLGIKLDDKANQANEQIISSADSQIAVSAIPTDEETVIADATRVILQGLNERDIR